MALGIFSFKVRNLIKKKTEVLEWHNLGQQKKDFKHYVTDIPKLLAEKSGLLFLFL